MGKTDPLQQSLCGFLGPAPPRAEEPAPETRGAQLQRQDEVLHHRQVREDRIALEDHAAVGRRFPGQRHAVQLDLAAARPLLAEQQAQEGGLAAAAGPDDGAELLRFDLQIDPFQHGLPAVALLEVAHGDQAHSFCSPGIQAKARRARSAAAESRAGRPAA